MLIVGDDKYNLPSFLDEFQTSSSVHLTSICDVIQRWQNDSDYIEITTSGSTSTPQTIKLLKASMIESALRTQEFFSYTSGDKSLLCLPVKFIGGMMMLIRSIVSDLDLYIVEPSLRTLKGISTQLDFVPMTPAQLAESIKVDIAEINRIDKILLGGGPVSLSLLRSIEDLEATVYHSFGMTETISHIAIRQLNQTEDNQLFKALRGVHLELDDDRCLIINADYIDKSVHTNDIVDLISNKEFIWKGRKDNVINSGGLKLYPELIEQKIGSFIQSQFIIVGIDDEVLGSKVCLIIESDDIINEQETISALSDILSKYELPKAIFTVPSFARTQTGKIIRTASLELAINDSQAI